MNSKRTTQAVGASPPVFLFGVDHSGTTILYRMLAQHPGLTWFSQFSLRSGEVPGRPRWLGAGHLDRWLRVLYHDWRKEEPDFPRSLIPRPKDEGLIWNYLLQEPADIDRLRACLVAFSCERGKKRFLAKLPAFRHHLGVLTAAFPQASFVHIIRDGRAVALSLRDKHLALQARDRPTPAGRRLSPEDALRWAAREWVDGLEAAVGAASLHLLEVRYEDLCRDVHGTLRTILRHCDLDIESFPFRRCPRDLSIRNGRWLENATNTELKQVFALQGDLLRRYGYPPLVPGAVTDES